MKVDWSILEACAGYASATHVPAAINALFSDSSRKRRIAYQDIDNYVVVQAGLFESAAYAARLLVDKVKEQVECLNNEVLNILFELVNGNAEGGKVKHGPLKGQPIEELCLDAVAEILPQLVKAKAWLPEFECSTIDAILDVYDDRKYNANI